MASARSDKAIRDLSKQTQQRLRANMHKYSWLNNWQDIAEADRLKIKKELAAYIAKQRKIILSGVIDERAVERIIKTVQAKFKDMPGKPMDFQALKNSVVAEMQKAVSDNIETIHTSQTTKIGLFKAKLEEQSIPSVSGMEMAGRVSYLPEITIGGKVIAGDPEKLWGVLSKNYGGIDTVTYRNGAKIPLNSYVDMKGITMATEVQTRATTMESAQRGIYTMQISRHNATDSCRLHEGEIVFVSDFARSQFLEKYGDEIPQAKTWNTIEAVKRDKSHIFLPNCRHTLIPFTAEILSPARMAELPKGRPLATSAKEAEALAAKYA